MGATTLHSPEGTLWIYKVYTEDGQYLLDIETQITPHHLIESDQPQGVGLRKLAQCISTTIGEATGHASTLHNDGRWGQSRLIVVHL